MEEETIVNEPVIEAEPVEEVIETVTPGSKTEPELLLKSLHDERDKRRELESELQRLKDVSENAGAVVSDEGIALQGQIAELKATIRNTEEKNTLQALESKYPALKDKASELEIYRLENPGMKLETAAKAFLTENDLLQAPKPRKGLETTNGGGRVPQKTGLTPDEIDEMRVNNYGEYTKRLRAGTLFS